MSTNERASTKLVPEVDTVLFLGVDAHRKISQLTIMDASGTILKRRRIPSSSECFRAALSEYQEPIKAVLEASYNWGPIYDWLDELVDDVVLAHPQKVRAIADARIKTDTIDSATLAHLLRADLIPEAYAPSKEVRAIKRVLRQRMFLVRVQTMVKNRIRALLAQHPVAVPEVSDLFGKAGFRWLCGLALPEPDGRLLVDDLELLQTLRARIATTTTTTWINELATGDEVVHWLASVPGIGPFFSVLIRYEAAGYASIGPKDARTSQARLGPRL